MSEFVQFPGFKVSPIDPSREVKNQRPTITFMEHAPASDYYEDDGEEDYCERCDNSGSINCYCGGDICCCKYAGERPCPDCDNW